MWREFVELAEKREEPFVALCARFGISRKTGYKWLNRFRLAGPAGLREMSRRPKSSPRRTPDAVVEAVLAMKRSHPEWSTGRLRAALKADGVRPLPAPSTIDLILRRQRDATAARHLALGPDAQRFEPNYRWLYQVGGELTFADRTTGAPMVVRDETTGFLLGATILTVRREEALTAFTMELLRRHGLPWRVHFTRARELRELAPCRSHTPLTVSLVRAGIVVEFGYGESAGEQSLPRQLAAKLAALPAYQRAPLVDRAGGSDMWGELEQRAPMLTLPAALAAWDRLREQHNFSGGHEAMQRRTPMSLYRPSSRPLPSELPVPTYPAEADVRLVSEKGIFTYQRRLVHAGRAFAGLCIEIKYTLEPERFVVLLAGQLLGVLDLGPTTADQTTSVLLGRH